MAVTCQQSTKEKNLCDFCILSYAQTMEQVIKLRPGTWVWNDEKKELQFARKRNTQICKVFIDPKSVLLQDRPSCRWGPGPKYPERALTPKYTKPPKKRKHEFVTLKDIKRVALTLIEEQERLCLTFEFSSVLRSKELDELLLAVINYIYFYLRKQLQRKRPKSLLPRQRSSDKVEEKSALDTALKQLAVKYSALILGEIMEKQQHMACGKSKASATWKDRRFYECLYSFIFKVVWVTFNRKNLELIQEELSRIFKTEYFNTKLEPIRNLPGERNKTSPSAVDRKTKSRPIHSIINQRSPLLTALMPTAKDKSPDLFQRRGVFPKDTKNAGTKNVLDYEIPSRVGIIGEPMRNFHFHDLTPLEPCEEEEDDPTENTA